MDGSKKSYHVPKPLDSQRQRQHPSSQNRQQIPIYGNPAINRAQPFLEPRVQSAIELYQHQRELELQRDMNLRRRIMLQQQQQILSEMDQQQLQQHLHTARISNNPLHQRHVDRHWIFKETAPAQPIAAASNLKSDEKLEQLYRQRERELFFRQQQHLSSLAAKRNPISAEQKKVGRESEARHKPLASTKKIPTFLEQHRKENTILKSPSNDTEEKSEKILVKDVKGFSLTREMKPKQQQKPRSESITNATHFMRKANIKATQGKKIEKDFSSINDSMVTVIFAGGKKGPNIQAKKSPKIKNTNPSPNLPSLASNLPKINIDELVVDGKKAGLEKKSSSEHLSTPIEIDSISKLSNTNSNSATGLKRSVLSEEEIASLQLHLLKRPKNIDEATLKSQMQKMHDRLLMKTQNICYSEEFVDNYEEEENVQHFLESLYSIEGLASIITKLKKSEVPFEDEPPKEVLENEMNASKNEAKDDLRTSLPQLPDEPLLSNEIGNEGDEIVLIEDDLQVDAKKLSSNPKVDGPVIISKEPESPLEILECKHAIDTWWPSNVTIKREMRMRGYKNDELDCDSIENLDGDIHNVENPNHRASIFSFQNHHAKSTRYENSEFSKESGVLEKLPHCLIHRSRHRRSDGPYEPLFCFQVSELYPTDVMVCCSSCHTWRHAICGGHHTLTGQSTTNVPLPFKPVCDLCHVEEKQLDKNPKAKCVIAQKRSELARRALATSFVMRHSSFAKHGGTYKWPLGSVSATHIGGHTRSVHARHERSEKQWAEMAMKLGNGLGYRPKERVKVRAREFERLNINLEDAELFTDKHNILQFLRYDTYRSHPAGYEKIRRNFFDPEDDCLIHLSHNTDDTENNSENHMDNENQSINELKTEKRAEENETVYEPSLDITSSASDESTYSSTSESETENAEVEIIAEEEEEILPTVAAQDTFSCFVKKRKYSDTFSLTSESVEYNNNLNKKKTPRSVDESTDSSTVVSEESNPSESSDDDSSSIIIHEEISNNEKLATKSICVKPGCKRVARYDSLFCSDSCGVASLEMDLIRSLEYSSILHPSSLRLHQGR